MKQYLSLLGLLTLTAHGQVFTFNSLNVNIPDGDETGILNNQTISLSDTRITDVNVTLEIVGRSGEAFNGDLRVVLSHNGQTAVLLNRVGKNSAFGLGYGDNGLSITLDDSAAHDVHTYRNQTGTLGSSSLTGTWQPDGRSADPSDVLNASDRDSLLNVFETFDPNGTWTLQVIDMETGGMARLVGWGLQITAVPEPHEYALVAGFGLAGFAVWRKRKQIQISSATCSRAIE